MTSFAGLGWRIVLLAAGLCAASAPLRPARAQEGDEAAVGPCSPDLDADGAIRSELPGCGRRIRPAPGTLDDELAFRREGHGAGPPRGRGSRRSREIDPGDREFVNEGPSAPKRAEIPQRRQRAFRHESGTSTDSETVGGHL